MTAGFLTLQPGILRELPPRSAHPPHAPNTFSSSFLRADLTHGDFTRRLPHLAPKQKERFDFLLFELRHSMTSQAHEDLVNTQLLKRARVNIGASPETLKAEAWRFFEEAGLSVSSLS